MRYILNSNRGPLVRTARGKVRPITNVPGLKVATLFDSIEDAEAAADVFRYTGKRGHPPVVTIVPVEG